MSETSTNKDLIIRSTIPIEAEKYRNLYGLDFVEADLPRINILSDSISKMIASVEECKRTVELFSLIDTSGRVIFEVPDFFLEKPLEPDQKIVIDTSESEKVASLSVDMQDRLLGVPIDECYQPLVDLRRILSDRASFSAVPFHEACGEWAGLERQFWVRQDFASRLVLMAEVLGDQDIAIHFEDGFRPLGVQEGLFKRRIEAVKANFPNYTEEQILREARSKTAITPRLASHKAGAAVDVRLLRNGKLDDIGHEYAEGGALVYLKSPFVTQEQWQNRQTLVIAASLCGLTMYIGEDWHLSYGDNLASLNDDLTPEPGYVAQYGPIKRIDHRSGQIMEVYSEGDIDNIF